MRKYLCISFGVLLTALLSLSYATDGETNEKEKEVETIETQHGLTSLPHELQSVIFQYLKPKNLDKVMRVCKTLSPLAREAFINNLQEKGPFWITPSQLDQLHEAAVKGNYIHLIKRIKLAHLPKEKLGVYEHGKSESITDDTLEKLKRFPNLTELTIIGASTITPAALMGVFRECSDLVGLSLIGCPEIKAEDILKLTEIRPNMISLGLDGYSELKDDDLIKIAESLKGLRRLELMDMPLEFITDKSIIEVAQKCPTLSDLFLARCPGITDASIIEVAQKCPDLRKLTLLQCDNSNLTENSIKQIVEHCKQLKELDLRASMDISYEFLQNLKRVRPDLKILP